jgi:ABC-type transport system involved in multi-copper enzyme maturation permease subunit
MRPNMIPYSTANVGNPVVASSLSYQMRRYERLDWTFAVGILATFLAVVMSFNALSGEKEEGTLKLLLTNRISRTSVLTAKLLALTASVFFPVLVGVLISMALMTLVTGIPYSGADLLRITAVLSMGLLLVLLFVSMGLFVSALMGQSSKSLVLLLLVWVVSVVIIPSLGRLITENVRAVVPAAEIERRIGELLGEAIEEYSGRDISHAPREALPVDASEFLWDEMMDKVEGRAQEIMDGNMRAKMDQVRIMEGIARISPVFLFKLGAWDMAGTGRLEDEHFAEDVRNEREEFLEFIRSQDAQDGGSPHILYRKWYLSYKAVDPAAVPRYTGGEVPVEISLRRGLPEAIGLAVWAAVMFLLAHVAFQRMDAR